MLGGSAEQPIIVDRVYDKQVLDIESSELLEEVGEYDESIDQSLHDTYGEDGEHDNTIDGSYGGMPLELYDNIVEFKSARCMRFVLADDNETLLYYNPSSSVNDQPKVVVKRGEVRRVIERIHDLIGHLGQKRTQIVVLKKLHWRSVRQDVRTFINNCAFCNQKKLEGKKILKAPVDVTSDNFDLNIEVRSKSGGSNETFDRLSFSLIGYNEQEVRAAAVTRMTAYTFKETASELRGRFARSNPGTAPTNFRRQPYIKRTRYSPYASGFILPYAARHKNEEPSFIEIFNDDRGEPMTSAYNGQTYPVEELVESQQIDERSVESNNMITNVERIASAYLKGDGRGLTTQPQSATKRDIPSKPQSLESGRGRQKKVANSANIGLVSRFNLALGDAMDCTELCDNSELLSSYESINTRPEMTVLPPIMLMPSVDPEVLQMQKELLMRQLRLQRMQEKVLQAQLNSLRIPIARYEELDPNGERVQILADGGEDFMGEPVDEEHELNVMNSGDESGDEILHVESR
ncbi:unnamed protein product [Angiostrongylus costaricensis]|uniref:Integrase_H2C2 domain-containing protein n=1 Tax=Angiostrongylus costaricensis TaxID=334426 RepID=A0A158PM48_ANGCS|nr:unnamed protein product [Angiostrongylus costaricensis]